MKLRIFHPPLFLIILIAIIVLRVSPLEAQRSGSQSGGQGAARGLPTWTIGLSTIGQYVPHYPGSDQQKLRLFPLPYFIYRRGRLTVSPRGIEGIGTGIRDLSLNLRFGFAIGIPSSQNDARTGMPDLDLLLLFGPSLDYSIYNSRRHALRLQLPVKPALSSDLQRDTRYAGAISEPGISYAFRGLWNRRSSMRISAGPVFRFDGLADHFYEVKPQYATAERPAFKAEDGYSSFRASLSLVNLFSRSLFLVAKHEVEFDYDSHNRNSPLHREDANHSFRLSLVYSFWQSR